MVGLCRLFSVKRPILIAPLLHPQEVHGETSSQARFNFTGVQSPYSLQIKKEEEMTAKAEAEALASVKPLDDKATSVAGSKAKVTCRVPLCFM